MSEPEIVHPRRLTRRDLLRRGAVVGGLLWTAPVIQSISSPAFAASPPFHSCCQCNEGPPFPSKIDGLTCADCQAYCTGHGGVKTYTRGTGCVAIDQVCIPTNTCPQVPCAQWQASGPTGLSPIGR